MIICEKWSKISHMNFKKSKCKIRTLNRLPFRLAFKLFGSTLKFAKIHKFIGITLSTKNETNLHVEHFNEILDKARRRLWQIKHVEFNKDG